MSNVLRLRLQARPDQTFRFARDFRNYGARIDAGAVVRMQVNLCDGSELIFSSNLAETNAKGRFVYDSASSVGWFEASLDTLRSFSPLAFGKKANFVASLEQDGGVEIIMAGEISWAVFGLIDSAGPASAFDATVGKTVFAEGDQSVTPILPISLESALAAAQAAVQRAEQILAQPSTAPADWNYIVNKPALTPTRFDVVSPSSSWVIAHGLGRVPIVSVYLANGEKVLTDVSADLVHINVVFAQPQSGFALAY